MRETPHAPANDGPERAEAPPHPKDRNDSRADAAAAIVIIATLCATAVYWLSGQ